MKIMLSLAVPVVCAALSCANLHAQAPSNPSELPDPLAPAPQTQLLRPAPMHAMMRVL